MATEKSPEPRPEVPHETQPAIPPEMLPEIRPELRPDTRPETGPEVRPEVRPETLPDAVPEVRPEVLTSTLPEARPAALAGTRPAATAGNRAAALAEPRKGGNPITWLIVLFMAAFTVMPLMIVLVNSFKGKFYISDAPFALPDQQTFVGLENYATGILKIGFSSAIGYSAFITVSSVLVLLLFTSMTAWFLTRVKNAFTSVTYYLLVFSMIVPFQMVMFSMSKIANLFHLDTPLGIVVIYLGFGAGLSVFMFSGFIKSIPIEIEEAATIDGCNPLQTFFLIVLPILKSTAITVSILNTMWIWNDFLLPYLVIGTNYKTIPVAVQGVLTGSYGGRDMGALMAMLILAILPIIIFYLASQKYLIKGVVAGAVKG